MSLNRGPRIVTSGLVLCLDAGNRNSYKGSGNSWLDLSGNNYTGTLNNSPTFSNSNSGIFTYDGVDDYVELGDNLDLVTSDISGFSWVNITTFKNYTAIIDKLASNGNYRLHVNLNKTVTFGIRNTASVFEFTSTSETLDVNKWYYLGFTHNITTKVGNIYINGVLKATTTFTIDRGNTGTTLRLGYASNNVVYGNFKQATVSIYNRELTAVEVQQNFNATRNRFGI
jgi:hypothetical protein